MHDESSKLLILNAKEAIMEEKQKKFNELRAAGFHAAAAQQATELLALAAGMLEDCTELLQAMRKEL